MWHHSAGQFETCAECRFDGAAYTDEDVAGTLRNLSGWAGDTIVGIDEALLGRRPAPTTWSPAEYLRHMKRVLWTMRFAADLAVDEQDHQVDGGPPPDATADDAIDEIDVRHEVVRIHEEAMQLHERFLRADDVARTRTVTVNGEPADLGGILRHALHDVTHHLSDIGRGVVALGAGMPTSTGRVARINASGGGVPKAALDRATVGYRGIDGDRQADRRNHGRVWQALCLWSSDVINALAADGHAVTPGSAGENLTIAGLDWAALRPGTRLRFTGGSDAAGGSAGDSASGPAGDAGVLVECTRWAAPCSTIADSFLERDFRRIDAVQHPGSARMYAKVLVDGEVRTGDRVEVC